MHEYPTSGWDTTPSWTVSRQKREVKRLNVVLEARFLFVPLGSEWVDFGSFLSKFREVGDITFGSQKIRSASEDENEGWSASQRV